MNKEHGYLVGTDASGREVVLATSLQCIHCGSHWFPCPGSGRVRGFCFSCMGPVCGRKCAVCVGPWEARMENIEAGRPELQPRRILLAPGWDGGDQAA